MPPASCCSRRRRKFSRLLFYSHLLFLEPTADAQPKPRFKDKGLIDLKYLFLLHISTFYFTFETHSPFTSQMFQEQLKKPLLMDCLFSLLEQIRSNLPPLMVRSSPLTVKSGGPRNTSPRQKIRHFHFHRLADKVISFEKVIMK